MRLANSTFQVLWQDGDRVLCRTWREDSGGSYRAVLTVTPVAEHPTAVLLDRIEHEYELKDELDSGWAARPLALERDGPQCVLVLEDGGEPLERLICVPMEMEVGRFLRLAVGIATALSKAHQRGLIHKDIKPANILVNHANGEVRLTGFGIAIRLTRERQAPEPPEVIEGTLAYMAPEQTGHMNRSIDSRSDLYALGVTFYRMLTGSLPFTATEPMDLVHCHIARKPQALGERSSTIPSILSAIVMKLLAKAAEERYQTAAGVVHDLRRCLEQWESGGHIDDFPLAEYDIPDRLVIPEKLYGRARDVENLLACFDRIVKSGAPELVLVSGYSGIGKSSVVNELHKALVPPRGLFAGGKFDQFKRDVPYSTLAQAFQSLVRPLLGKSDTELSGWRTAFLEALGPNGRLLTELIPELKLIIGDQPPLPELLAKEAQRRFHLVFRRFIGVFARPEHPLALFLDDLQWLDRATLDLLEDLLTQTDLRHLMLIGAYRDNEVTASHPLIRKIEGIKASGGRIVEISLAPLAMQHLGQLIAEALRCEPENAAPLTQLVHEKTGGNPFFAVQFISSLAEEGMLTFDHNAGHWSWNLERIHAKGYTDNIVDLMVAKLTRLPAETQHVLQRFACLGNVADIKILSIALEISEQEVHRALCPAVRQETVERLADAYRFVHDRIREAAYSLLPTELREEAHLRIGRLLASHASPEERGEAIFDIVNQLNRGVALVNSQEEREQLAEFNLLAGKRAKMSAAYYSALNYLTFGAGLLPEDSWERRYELSFALELNRAECELMQGDLTTAEERLSRLSRHAANIVDKSATTGLQLVLYQISNRPDSAVQIGQQFLAQLHIELPRHPEDAEVHREYRILQEKLQGRPVGALFDLPLASDSHFSSAMQVLMQIATPAHFTDRNLYHLVLLRMANLSIEHGNCDESCYAFVYLGGFIGSRFGDYRTGYSLAQLSLDLVEKKGLNRFKARVYLGIGQAVIPWTQHLRAGLPPLREGLRVAIETGDPIPIAHGYSMIVKQLLAIGDPLEQVQRQAEEGIKFARSVRFDFFAALLMPQLGLVKSLRGLTATFGSFSDQEFDEGDFERYLESNPSLRSPAGGYWLRMLQACFYAADYRLALAAAATAQPILRMTGSIFDEAEFHFYSALTKAAACDSATPAQQRKHFNELIDHRMRLESWSENGPENFENRVALVRAEIARLEGRELEAEHLYERAIRSARENGFVQNEGLAYELAGRFYLQRGFGEIARHYLRNARNCYLRWGADGKVRQLDQLYPQLRPEPLPLGPTSTIEAPVEQLDLATVVKVSQAVSSEIVLDKLIDTLMRLALEHAGAERGLLILSQGAELRIAAEATIGGNTINVRLGDKPPTEVELPDSMLQHILRTRESVILDDAFGSASFAQDPYILQHKTRSVRCLPLLNQTKLVGVLYLENNLAPRVFAPAASATLKVLAAQGAIALENSRLYRELAEHEDNIQRLQAALAHANRVTAIGQLTAEIAHDVKQPIGAAVSNAQAALRWLSRQEPALEEVRRALDRIVENGNLAAEIVDRVLALVKNSPLRNDLFDINEAIREVLDLVEDEAVRNGVLVETDLADDLPIIDGDRVQLQQVILNLIMNAVEAMSCAGNGRRELHISSRRTESTNILVCVRDSGPGLAPDALKRLFEPFYTTKPGGLGLGLSICRSIIEAHGGRMWATTNAPQGASFEFTLPAHPDPNSQIHRLESRSS